MSIFFLRQIECKLIIDGKIVVAGAFARIAVIVIGTIAFLAVVARQPLCAAIAFGCFRMTLRCLTITFAFTTHSAINRIAPIARTAGVTICSCRQIIARLVANSAIETITMTIALAIWALREIPELPTKKKYAIMYLGLFAMKSYVFFKKPTE